MANESSEIELIVEKYVEHIKHQMKSRSYRVANELRNNAQLVLRGARHGRRYKKPNTKAHYTASAPGEPPAVRTGTFRASWMPSCSYGEGLDGYSVKASINSYAKTENGKYVLGDILEEGTKKMAPRPYKEKIEEKTRKTALKIFDEPYF